MGPSEARSLLKEAGVEADQTALRDLLQRTEGWPAGLYIAALAINSGTRHTHLSYQEISERLFVSKNTVKTQAYSAYRKLGVSTRSEAVVRARELGLDAF